MLHEIGHTVGIATTQANGGNLAINQFLTPIGPDPNPDLPGNTLLRFNGPTTTAVLTRGDNGLHLDEATHDHDLLEPSLGPGRKLISELDASILRDAYGYDIVSPSTLQTFDANLNKSTRVLTVSGDLGDDLRDNITVTRSSSGPWWCSSKTTPSRPSS